MWESVDFSECAKNHGLFASDGSGGSRKTPQSLRQVAFGVATFDMHIGNVSAHGTQTTSSCLQLYTCTQPVIGSVHLHQS